MKLIAMLMVLASGLASAAQIPLLAPAGYNGGFVNPCVVPVISVLATGYDANRNILGELKAKVHCNNRYGTTTYHTDTIVWDFQGNILVVEPFQGNTFNNFVANYTVEEPYSTYEYPCQANLTNGLAVVWECWVLPGSKSYLITAD